MALLGCPDGAPRATSVVLSSYRHLEEIHDEVSLWEVDGPRGSATLAGTFAERREDAMLFRALSTVPRNVRVRVVHDWHCLGPTEALTATCERTV